MSDQRSFLQKYIEDHKFIQTFDDYQKSKERKVYRKFIQKLAGSNSLIESFDDWDIVMWGAESFASEIGMGIHRHNKYPHGQRTISSRQNYKPPPPPEPMSYPIFGVTQFVVIIDRIISFESNE